MPRSQVSLSIRNRVRVTARGATLADLQNHAKAQAAEFFGVDATTAELKLDGLEAVPYIEATDGTAVLYKTEVLVTYEPPVDAVTGAVRSPGPISDDWDEDDDEADGLDDD